MLIELTVALVLGSIVGGFLGALATRRAKFMFGYMAMGAVGALIYAAMPYVQGHGYLNSSPKMIAIVSAAFTGLSILFTSGGRR